MELGGKDVESRLCQIMKEVKKGSPQKYVVFKFISRVKTIEKNGLVSEIQKNTAKNLAIKTESQINLSEQVNENFVLKNYEEFNVKKLEETVKSVLDFYNAGST